MMEMSKANDERQRRKSIRRTVVRNASHEKQRCRKAGHEAETKQVIHSAVGKNVSHTRKRCRILNELCFGSGWSSKTRQARTEDFAPKKGEDKQGTRGKDAEVCKYNRKIEIKTQKARAGVSRNGRGEHQG